MDNKLRNIMDHFAKRSLNFESYSDWCKDRELIDIAVKPLKKLSRNALCIDLGGGTGVVARRLAREHQNPWVVLDLSLKMLLSHHDERLNYINADIHHLPIRDESVGFVLLRQVIHYLDLNKALSEAHRILASRGQLSIIQKINPESVDSSWHNQLINLRQPLRRQSLKFDDLCKILERNNFEIVETTNIIKKKTKPLNEWLSRGGILDEDHQKKQMQLLRNIPDDYKEKRQYKISNGTISYLVNWSVITVKKKSLSTTYPYGVVSLIVERIEKNRKTVLMQKRLKRSDHNYFGVWELPQGKLEIGESITTAMVRELFAETSLEHAEIINGKAKDSSYNSSKLELIEPFCAVREYGEHEYLAICFIIQATGDPKSRDIERYHRFFTREELINLLDKNKIYPLNVPMIEKYVKLK